MTKSQQKLNHAHFKQLGPLVVIAGPTACGKTSLALDMAGKFNGEIVCADSRTIYKGMNIGTAKPTAKQQTTVKHHLIDLINPNQYYSVANYVDQAKVALIDIWSRGKLGLLVGGSGLYIDALLYDYHFRSPDMDSDKPDLDNFSIEQLVEIGIERHSIRPIQSVVSNRRRLEQFVILGPANKNDRQTLAFNCLGIYLDLDETKLRLNISNRTTEMLNKGLVNEVKQLRKVYGTNCLALHSTGYYQVCQYLDRHLTESQLAPAINQATWKLVRKQRTWFKRDKYLHKIPEPHQARQLISHYLSSFKALKVQ